MVRKVVQIHAVTKVGLASSAVWNNIGGGCVVSSHYGSITHDDSHIAAVTLDTTILYGMCLSSCLTLTSLEGEKSSMVVLLLGQEWW